MVFSEYSGRTEAVESGLLVVLHAASHLCHFYEERPQLSLETYPKFEPPCFMVLLGAL